MTRTDGFVDFDVLPDDLKSQASAFVGSFATLTPEDARLFAFRINVSSGKRRNGGLRKAGDVSTSRKDLRPSTAWEAST